MCGNMQIVCTNDISNSCFFFCSYKLLQAFTMSGQGEAKVLAVPDQFCKNRIRVSHGEYQCFLYLQSKYEDLESAFNVAKQKKFFRSTPDFWIPSKGDFLLIKEKSTFPKSKILIDGLFNGSKT